MPLWSSRSADKGQRNSPENHGSVDTAAGNNRIHDAARNGTSGTSSDLNNSRPSSPAPTYRTVESQRTERPGSPAPSYHTIDNEILPEFSTAMHFNAGNTESNIGQSPTKDSPNAANGHVPIEEAIRQSAVDENLRKAIEEFPESFNPTPLLYVLVEVNGHKSKAMLCLGAQTTIMSTKFAKECGLIQLVDRRWAGIAYGVGATNILGRVPNAVIKIGATSMPCDFTVMDQPADMLLGLDVLKRHRISVNLQKGALEIGQQYVFFLSEEDVNAAHYTVTGKVEDISLPELEKLAKSGPDTERTKKSQTNQPSDDVALGKTTTMLYIPVDINGQKLMALLDTGSEVTILHQSAAEACRIMRLNDTRFQGTAEGVGTARILGRIHLADVRIGDAFFQSAFTIMNLSHIDCLLGLDFLKRHGARIDLKYGVLEIREQNVSFVER